MNSAVVIEGNEVIAKISYSYCMVSSFEEDEQDGDTTSGRQVFATSVVFRDANLDRDLVKGLISIPKIGSVLVDLCSEDSTESTKIELPGDLLIRAPTDSMIDELKEVI
jgi:hypothetical protein